MEMAVQMSLLVINCGTSSVKTSLFLCHTQSLERFLEGHFKNIFSSQPVLEIKGPEIKKNIAMNSASSYVKSIEKTIEQFELEGFSPASLKGIGHRVVHGGEKYTQSVVITPEVEKQLQTLSNLAPLHNPPALEGIACASRLFPQILQAAVFDTAFHATLPLKASIYPIPWELAEKHKIKRYGFHGIAHAFSWKKYAETFGHEKERHKVITVHLGSGCSLAAIDQGTSVDTSMGFTPLDGVMMATRCGELDPAIMSYLCDKESKSPGEILALFNQQSGLLGVSGKTADMQELLKMTQSDDRAKLAIEMFIYRILKKIGSFIAVLGGIDALIFSGGIGENAPEIRRRLAEGLLWYGVSLDDGKNDACSQLTPGEIRCIGRENSSIKVCVVSSDENLFIAQEMSKLLKSQV